MIERDRRRELELLGQATRLIPSEAGLYVATVTTRLDDVETRRGTSGWRDLPEVVGEISEETVDIAGWGVGFDLLTRELADVDRAALEPDLVAALTFGACAWSATRSLTEKTAALTTS